MSTRAFSPERLSIGARQYLRRYVDTSLRPDVAAIGIMLAGLFVAVLWPANAYLLLLTAVATNIWYFGRSRALVISIGVILIAVAFIAPSADRSVLVGVFKDWPHVALFIAVVALVGAATEVLRRARTDAERHVVELNRVNADLERHMEEVQSISDQLSESNEALEDALAEAERTAARASALQEVTAALSMASTTSDIATAVLTRGLRAMQATRGHLVLVDSGRIGQVIGSVGWSDDTELTLAYARGDENLPLVEAVREAQPVWLRTAAEYDACFSNIMAKTGDLDDASAHLALPLIHAGEVVGGLAFDFAFCPAIHATDELFTSLLAQAAADALLRARSYDQEREARRTAELLSRAREDVLGVVAHDLRNPLNLVSMTTQLLLEPDLTPERRKSTSMINARAVARMDRLIGDLLDVVRMEAGHLSLDVGPCDVTRVLVETMEAFQARAAEQGISLVLSPEPPNVIVQADEERVLQLIDNLVGNALKFTPSGGRVSIGGFIDANELRVSVADSGPGIPEEQCAKLFDRFWQARGTDRRGLGLGLPIAKGIAEAHGGRLWVESIVGSGTTFHFTMPLTGKNAN
ncbi:MAG TPA: HAMP domain-containing sensor histidine kinase [Gemmatimonadaceae bacterium]